MKLASNWKDYEILDASNGEKLERFGDYVLLRPDPTVIWDNGSLYEKYKDKIHAVYHRSSKGGGSWDVLKPLPDKWQIKYDKLTFNLKLMGFKHTGIFPEQAVNWDFLKNKISGKKDVKVLNLFAYTGGASVVCLAAGASVVHVDSSKGMVAWCKDNVNDSGYGDRFIRYIVDDVVKFVKREIRRGNKYDGIIMDPPSFGRGANGEVWHFEDGINELISLCSELLSDDALFFLISSYSTGISGNAILNILKMNIKKEGVFSTEEIGLSIKNSDLVLPCGCYVRWESN